MPDQEVKLSRGLKANMPQTRDPGTILIATDTGEAYLDDTASSRVQLKDSTKLPLEGGTMTGPINMGSNRITNIQNPAADSDVANLGTVRTEIQSSQYTADDGKINIDNGEHTISHGGGPTSGAGTTNMPSGQLSAGQQITFPRITYDATGHITGVAEVNATLPELPSSLPGSNTANKLATARTIDGVNFDGSANIIHYGTCSTAAGTAAKTVACTGFVLQTGARIIVLFSNANTAANPTLNVNSTGAHAIRYQGANITATYIQNGAYEFVYDGTNYQYVGSITDEGTSYSGVAPISVSGNQISHQISGVTADTYGPADNAEVDYGEGITIPSVEVDATGHVTSANNRVITLPDAPAVPHVPTTIEGVNVPNSGTNLTRFVTCYTAADTAAKTVTKSDFVATTGSVIYINFSLTNTASNPTLNVNNTGAYPIYYGSTRLSDPSVLSAGYVIGFVFESVGGGSEKWRIIGAPVPEQQESTAYTGAKGIEVEGTTIQHTNYIIAGNRGPTSATTLNPGTTVQVPYIAYDTEGHITTATNRGITLSSNILDTSDIISTLSSSATNSQLLGAKIIVDTINDLIDRIEALETKLTNVTYSGGTTTISGTTDITTLEIGNATVTYDSSGQGLKTVIN